MEYVVRRVDLHSRPSKAMLDKWSFCAYPLETAIHRSWWPWVRRTLSSIYHRDKNFTARGNEGHFHW